MVVHFPEKPRRDHANGLLPATPSFTWCKPLRPKVSLKASWYLLGWPLRQQLGVYLPVCFYVISSTAQGMGDRSPDFKSQLCVLLEMYTLGQVSSLLGTTVSFICKSEIMISLYLIGLSRGLNDLMNEKKADVAKPIWVKCILK